METNFPSSNTFNISSIFTFILVLLLFSLVIIYIPIIQVDHDLAEQRITKTERPQQVDDYRRTIAQIVGGVIVGIGLYFTKRRIEATEDQLRIMEQGQVTDRFSKAIIQLGSQEITERLGGIYALERIAKDSGRDHWTVMETLCAFVRDKSQIQSEGGAVSEDQPVPHLPTDLQAACTVIGRRNTDNDPKDSRLNFRGAHLPKVNFHSASLAGSNFYEAILTEAIFREADLEGTTFWKADLSGISVEPSELCCAALGDATFSEDMKDKVEELCPEALGPSLVLGEIYYDQTDVPIKEES